MYCRANELPDAEVRAQVRQRVEAVLAPHAHLIDCFELTAPQDQADIQLAVYWRNRQRADTLIPIHDETSPTFETEVIALLAP